MASKKDITEEMKEQDKWYEDAKKVTVETLPEFIRHLTEDYHHNYGTICHAMAACGLAAIHAVDNTPAGGITGFQAGCIMWQIIREMNFQSNKCGLKIVDYDSMLYPQNSDSFDKTITIKVFDNIQKQARLKIDKLNEDHEEWIKTHAHWVDSVKQFEIDVVDWQKEHPEYPKYSENPMFYHHISVGKAEEWEEEHKKEEAGVMFFPEEPYEPSVHPDVLKHWKSIVAGNVPFGYQIKEV